MFCVDLLGCLIEAWCQWVGRICVYVACAFGVLRSVVCGRVWSRARQTSCRVVVLVPCGCYVVLDWVDMCNLGWLWCDRAGIGRNWALVGCGHVTQKWSVQKIIKNAGNVLWGLLVDVVYFLGEYVDVR